MVFGKARFEHAYVFAHRALPEAIFEHDAIQWLAQEGGVEALRGFWKHVADAVGYRPWRIPTELNRELLRLGDVAVILITFPKAKKVPEAHFALVIPGDTPHYFTLEKGESGGVLGGWTRNGDHQNYGPCVATAEAFLDAIGSMIKPRED